MADHNLLGKKGEEIAKQHLIKQGYKIRHYNWRFRKNEIDIIAEINNLLVVIEVKSRRNDTFENPKDAVTKKKQKFIIYAADAYIQEYNLDMEVRFDIISIIFEDSVPVIEHIKDAFQPSLL